jgi:hypothetical protein
VTMDAAKEITATFTLIPPTDRTEVFLPFIPMNR